MNDVLRQVTGKLELGDETVSVAQIAGEVLLFKRGLAGDDLLNFPGEDFVADLFAVKELGAFGGIVDDLRDLDLVLVMPNNEAELERTLV